MTFGQMKSSIEKNLVESYSDQDIFKKSLREFKKNILNNKSLSSLYTLYDQLSKPQGLSESDAKDFLNEAILLIQETLRKGNIPKIISESKRNDYEDIDTLVYSTNLDISQRVKARKNILSKLMETEKKNKDVVNLPIKTMNKIVKHTLSVYLESLDEKTKKDLMSIISEDTSVLEKKYQDIKSSALDKLNNILESQKEIEIKEKISETIDRIKTEKFDQLNFIKLKNLEESL